VELFLLDVNFLADSNWWVLQWWEYSYPCHFRPLGFTVARGLDDVLSFIVEYTVVEA